MPTTHARIFETLCTQPCKKAFGQVILQLQFLENISIENVTNFPIAALPTNTQWAVGGALVYSFVCMQCPCLHLLDAARAVCIAMDRNNGDQAALSNGQAGMLGQVVGNCGPLRGFGGPLRGAASAGRCAARLWAAPKGW